MKSFNLKSAAQLLCAAVMLGFASCGNNSSSSLAKMISEIRNADLIPVCEKGSREKGYVNSKGEEVIPARFIGADYFHEGLAMVTDSTGRKGFIDTKGNWVIEPKYASASDFNEGKALVALPDSGLTAIDKNGKVLFSLPDAATAYLFVNGICSYTKTDGTAGMITDKGVEISVPDWCINCEPLKAPYWQCKTKDNKKVLGKVENDCLVDALPDFKFEIVSFNWYNQTFVIKSGEKYGLANFKGELKCNPQYPMIRTDADMFIFQNSKEKFGWLNAEGEEVIAPKYKDLMYKQYNNDYFIVSTTGSKWQIIDKKGNTILGPKYDRIMYTWTDGVFSFKKDNEWGLMKADGTVLCKPQFESIISVANNMLMVTSGDDKWGLIDEKGKYLGDPIYGRADLFDGITTEARSDYLDCEAIQAYVNELVSKADLSLVFGQIANNFSLTALDMKKRDEYCCLSTKYFPSMKIAVEFYVELSGPCLTREGYSSRYVINSEATPIQYWIKLRFASQERCVEVCKYLADANHQDLGGEEPQEKYFIISIHNDKKYTIFPNEVYL